jgi:hypothetical protein
LINGDVRVVQDELVDHVAEFSRQRSLYHVANAPTRCLGVGVHHTLDFLEVVFASKKLFGGVRELLEARTSCMSSRVEERRVQICDLVVEFLDIVKLAREEDIGGCGSLEGCDSTFYMLVG